MWLIPKDPWLYPEELPYVVKKLLEYDLIKFDNSRSLPLKNGGTTDIYINLRNARNNPEAIRFISDLFAIPLQRLGVDRFVEIPDSVSCFAGPLAIKTGKPYLTVREQPKAGRISAKTIGNAVPGENVCILDDVVTDGASKIVPYLQCLEYKLRPKGLIVLVDRQQGWQKLFSEQGIQLPVWSGMTLHDVRQCLIKTLRVMERCDLEVKKKNPIIVALDGMTWDDILPIVDRLRTTGCIFKVNDLLINEGVKDLLPKLSTYGRVMADLKIHDIGNTGANIAKHLCDCPPWAVTVHALGGREMIDRVVGLVRPFGIKVLAVTVLTSMNKEMCEEVFERLPLEQVRRLAAIAYEAGADGLVCSPEEAQELRSVYPDMLLVTPGIRSEGIDAGDQKRIATPLAAMANGSNHLVMGRQILGAPNPVEEVLRVLNQELNITL